MKGSETWKEHHELWTISEGARDKTEKESGSQIECLAKGLDFYSIGDGNQWGIWAAECYGQMSQVPQKQDRLWDGKAKQHPDTGPVNILEGQISSTYREELIVPSSVLSGKAGLLCFYNNCTCLLNQTIRLWALVSCTILSPIPSAGSSTRQVLRKYLTDGWLGWFILIALPRAIHCAYNRTILDSKGR